MTAERFLARHGKNFDVLKADLLALLQCGSPAYSLHKAPVTPSTEGSVALLGTIQGYSFCMSNIEKLGDAGQEQKEEETFTTTPEEQITAETT